ncbi:MAG: tRNA (5-methylaminomethyl-2-thiouridine)(34)-methyltransferase MnmD [Salinivirgaceae bacterium]|nr:tRNA (5-methylaminomethyl-2-thiouridine)(34)-methyltransferase MnmD [Salinivirgaceae bacterium]
MEKPSLKREIITTSDGSHTLYIPELNENYHSTHGAIQESMHVFIRSGLELFKEDQEISILEIGFGTGLNALLALNFASKNMIQIFYKTVEKYPITEKEYSQLNFANNIDKDLQDAFLKMHQSEWNVDVSIHDSFTLNKLNGDLIYTSFEHRFNVIFFDAFAPDIQPKLWTVEVFKKMYKSLVNNGVLVTYSAKGQVRRNMIEAGFKVERLPGPPGKREMLRAIKTGY